MNLKIYRLVSTGVFAYIGHDGSRELFRADCSSVSRFPEVSIHTADNRFHFLSEFNPATTMIPGVTCRYLRNRKNNSVSGTLRFEDEGFYSLFAPEGMYTIEDRGGSYLAFENNERLVLTMKRADPREGVPAALRQQWQWYDLEPYFTVTTDPRLPGPTAAILSSFPLLRFDRGRR